MKKTFLGKGLLVLGVLTLWLWQANRTLDDSQTVIIRGQLGTLATNVLEAHDQPFEVRGDLVYIDASDRQETAENLSAALTTLEFTGAHANGMLIMNFYGETEERFPVFGEEWEPLGYYTHDAVYFEHDPKNPRAIHMGEKKGYVYKTKLDSDAESELYLQRRHDHQAIRGALEKIDPRFVSTDISTARGLPNLGETSWDTPRPIQKL